MREPGPTQDSRGEASPEHGRRPLVVLLAVFGTVVVTLGALAALFVPRILHGGGTAQRPFESVAWRSAAVGRPTDVRLQMVTDLLARGLLEGRSRSEVTELLGEPDRTADTGSGTVLLYALGPVGGLFPVQGSWLVVELSAAGRVTGARRQ